VVRDVVDPITDERLASFVVGSHIKNHPTNTTRDQDEAGAAAQAGALPQDLLRKYILYAKKTVSPKLQQMDQEKIAKLYGELRRESQATNSIPITLRHVESMIRIAEAHARMHLRDYVRQDDVDMAIRVIVTSFVETQKFSVMKSMQRHFQKYITYKRDNAELLMFVLKNYLREEVQYRLSTRPSDSQVDREELDLDEFVTRARALDIHDLTDFYKSDEFLGNGFSVDVVNHKIIKAY